MRSDNSDPGNRLLDAVCRLLFGLSGRLAGLFLLLALIPLAIAASVAFQNGQEALKEHIGLQLSAQADHIAESADHLIENGRTSLKNWAKLSVMYDLIGDDADGRITGTLATLARDQTILSSLIAVSPSGKVVAASDPQRIGESMADQEWFRHAQNMDLERTDKPFQLKSDATGGYYFISPIIGEGKRRPLLGYLSAHLSKDRLADHVRALLPASLRAVNEQYLVHLLDDSGTPLVNLSSARASAPIVTDPFPFHQLSTLQQQERAAPSNLQRWTTLQTASGDEFLVGYTHPQRQSLAGQFVSVSRPLQEAYEPIYLLRRQIIGIGFGLAFLATALAIGVATRLSRPIEQLTRGAEAVASGDFTPLTLPMRRQDEIGVLARAFDHMREDLLVLTQDLEYRVQARTAELRHANASLQVQIKERERAERVARASEERFHRMVSQVKDYAIIMLDPAGVIAHWNDGAERLEGYAAEEILGRHFSCFYPPEEVQAGKPARMLAQAAEKGSVEDEDWRVRKDGSRFWAHATITAIHDGDGKHVGFSKLTRDLTAQKEAEKDKASLQTQLLQAQKMEAVGRLAGGIAHDFNNLLTVITGYTQMIQMGIKADDPLVPAVGEIAKSAERAASLTQQLLAFSRKQMLRPTQLSLNEVAAQLERMLRPLIGEDIRLDTVYANDLARVKADRGQVEQIIMNLVVNARDAMPKGGRLVLRTGNAVIMPEQRDPTGIVPSGRYVTLEVLDTGCGMDAATKARAFEPFFTTKEPGKGTGLGLATVYGIVKQSGGYVTVESEPNKGSAFTVYFPAVQDEEAEASVEATATPPVQSAGKGAATILLVEDESSIRRLLQGLLASHGYKVLTAQDGEAGWVVGSSYSGPIDLLVTDVVMPKLSGAEMAKRLLEKHPHLKVLYMSGYTDESIVQHGVLEPGIAFLSKPFKPHALIERVRQILTD